ncbi:hypothetical protein UFOVP367_43 [uncultured Caudovirales phage]|uniref:Uncharacterized protein n=1 Tax=uncultured Caudovirales phage TaxID=2100421 RepID=A0A6J7X173_9CAUD|nr:hypothetical protein UFOVP367_43 [uncultured Caudovirales phage]
MAITHDLIAKAGEYQKDGETKTRWHKVGVAMTNKSGGTALLIESLPVNFDGWIQMREPQPRDGSPKQEDKTDLPF